MCLLLLGLMQPGPCAISTAGERMHSEVCGKSGTCRPYGKAVTHLPAVSLREKGGVLGGSGICRILPFWDSGSAGKTRDLPTRRRFGSFFATCGFVVENRVVLGGFRFFPALPEIGRFSCDVWLQTRRFQQKITVGWFQCSSRTKMARYVPRQSDTSEAIASSVFEFSHALGAFRAALIRSAPLSKRPDSPIAKNASPSRMATIVSGLGSLEGKGRGPAFASSTSCLRCSIDTHLI